MANAKNKKVTHRIIKVLEYKGAFMMVQQFSQINNFQVVVFYKNNFYQAREIIKPDKSQKEHTIDDIAKIGNYMLDIGFQMVDALEAPAGKMVN